MTLRLIATDLDGTLLGGTAGRYGFLPAGVAALEAAVAQGVKVAVVTGRDLPFIERLLLREGVDPSRAGWPHVIIAEERVIFYLDEGVYRASQPWNDEVLAAERSHFAAIQEGVEELLRGSLVEVDPTARRIEREKEEERGFVEVRFSDAAAARRGELVLSRWLAAARLPYYALRNVAGVAVRHRLVGKGAVLGRAIAEMNIPASDVLALGDSTNDLSMLDGSHGFQAAVPGNAEEEVREAVIGGGGYVATARCGAGVAEAVYLALGKEGEPCALPCL